MVLARGKMRVTSVKLDGYNETVKFDCLYEEDQPEDTKFSKTTPTGNMELAISNPKLAGKFQPGQSYYVDLTPVE